MVSRTLSLLGVMSCAVGTMSCQRTAVGSESDDPPATRSVTAAERGDDDDDALSLDRLFLPAEPGERVRPQRPDKELRKMLEEVDRKNLEASVQTLVGFGTRHTLSSQTDPVRGIGAATRWATAQLQASAARSNGHMTVETQSFVQPPSTRIPSPTPITNVVATLHGSQTPDRVYVVSAHIDSRVTDVLNPDAEEPGADDDASGVAMVLELARVLATY